MKRDKAVKMGIIPADDDVQRVMEVSDSVIAADEKASPDRGANLTDKDPKLTDFDIL